MSAALVDHSVNPVKGERCSRTGLLARHRGPCLITVRMEGKLRPLAALGV